MVRFISIRLLFSLTQIVLLLGAIFLAVRVTGDPANVMLPPTAVAEDFSRLNESLGLNRPVSVQFFLFVKGLFSGDLGTSFKGNLPIAPLLFGRLANSAKLAFAAAIVVLIWTFPLGVLAARYKGSWIDSVASSIAVAGFSAPNFLLGIILIRIFAVDLNLLPAAGTGSIDHYILPAITLGTTVGAGMMQLMRSGMIEADQEPFIFAAKAKGLSDHVVIWRHQVLAAVMPVLTYAGMYLGTLLGGAIVVEVVFGWPGMGRLAYEAAIGRDYPLLQAIVLVLGIIIIIGNMLVDLSYAYIDPRVRLGR